MNPDLSDDIVDFEDAARHAFDDLGSVGFARRAEADPTVRTTAGDVLKTLGIDDLDPRNGAEPAAAAAVLCRAAGSVALAYPLESMLLGDPETGRPFAVVGPDVTRVDHGDLASRWDVATLDGATTTASSPGTRLGTRLGPFCTDLTLDTPFTDDPTDAQGRLRRAWWSTLTAWRILGALESAVTLAARHTSERTQFDKPLTAFQTVRFSLADASVATTGLGELARFTLWRLTEVPEQAEADALALRCHAQDTARDVLRSTQHLHGAAGLCDDYDISILVRHLQPTLRLPESTDATAARLARVIAEDGFAGLFDHRARSTSGAVA